LAITATDEFVIPIRTDDKISKSLAKANKAAKKAIGSFDTLQRSVIVLNQAFGLTERALFALGRVFDATAGKAELLEKNIAEITTLLDDATGAQELFTEQVLRLQAQFGTDQTDLTKAFYQALSSGVVDSTNAMDLLISAQKLAIGGITSLNTSVDGLTTIMGAYGLGTEKASQISDALFIGMKRGKTTIDELSRSLGLGAAIASASNVSFQELVATTSAITTGGVDTNMALTQVRSAIIALARQTEPMEKIMAKLGITSVQTAIAQDGLVGTLKRIVAATGGTTEELTQMFGRVEAVNAVLALTSDDIGQRYVSIMNEMGRAAQNVGETTEEAFNKMSRTASFRLGLFRAKFEIIFTRIGIIISHTILPAVDRLTNALGGLEDFLDRINRAFQRINFERIAQTVDLLAASMLALASPLIAKALIAIAPAMTAAIAPVAFLATKFILLSAGITSTVLAIDVLIRNFERLDKVGIFVLNRLVKWVEATVLSFFLLTEKILEFQAKLGIDTERALNNLRKDMSGLAGVIDDLNERLGLTEEQLKDTFQDIDFGLSEELKKFFLNLTTGIDKIEKKTLGIGKAISGELPDPTARERAIEFPQLFDEKQITLITNAFGDSAGQMAGMISGALGPLLGVVGAADVIADAILKLIDFAPQFIDKVASIFEKLTDLPERLAVSIANLGDQILRFTKDFGANLVKWTEDIANSLADFLLNFPDAVLEGTKSFEKAFDSFLERAPELTEKLTAGLVSNAPRLAIALATHTIKVMPRVIGAWIRNMPKLAAAFVDGVVLGLKAIANEIANFFGFDDIFDIDFGEVEKQVKDFTDKIVRSASEVFQVLDLQAEARGLDIADRIRNSILNAMIRVESIFDRIWNKLVEAWRHIWNTILKPFVDLLTDTWRLVWDNVLAPIYNLVTGAWKWVWDNVISKISGAITGAWKWVEDNILGKLQIKTPSWLDELDDIVSDFRKTPSWIKKFANLIDDLDDIEISVGGGGGGSFLSFAKGGLIPDLNKVQKILRFAHGGLIPHGVTRDGTLYAQGGAFAPRGTDTVPTMTTPGEFIVNRESTRANLGLLGAINRSRGPISPGTTNISVVVNAKTNLDGDTFRREVMPVIKQELKSESQRGSFILDKRGIR
jgi:TP901 family phage tail tape measure protein